MTRSANEKKPPAPAVPKKDKAVPEKHREELLDEALEESFPASDVPAVTWPENKT